MPSTGDDQAALIAAEQLAAIVASADDAVVSKRLDGTVVSWNAGAQRLFGYTAEDMIGRSVTILLPEDRQHEEAEIIARIQKGEIVRPFETVRRRKDGELIDVSVSISPLRNAAGQVVGASKIARDISELVRGRQREQRLANLLRAMTRASTAIVQRLPAAELFDEICRICVEHGGASSAYLVELGAEQAQLKASAGLAPAAAALLTRQPLRHKAAARALASGEPVVVEDIAPRFNAVEAWDVAEPADYSLAAVPFRRGEEVAGVLVLLARSPGFFDQVVMGLLGELVSDLSFALSVRARDLEFKGIVESAMDAIIAVDADHRVRLFNPAAERIFGWSAEEASSRPIDILIPAPLRDGHRRLMGAFAEAESEPQRMGAPRQLTGLHRNGTVFPIEATVSRFGSGRDLRMIVVVRDASALREAEAARRAQASAEAASRAKSEFLSQLSHELRTPLNAVLGFVQVMLEDGQKPLSDPHRLHALHIRTAGQHLETLISDLLDLARVETGRLRVDSANVPLAPLLAHALEAIAPMARTANVALMRPGPAEPLPVVRADRTRLRQIVFNLVSNAIKYNRPGGEVRIAVTTKDDCACLTVTDTGHGMTPDQLEALYTPYNRLGWEGSGVDGLGIGLVVTRQLVELMNGTLEITSEPGRGTCASLVLRLAPEGEAVDSTVPMGLQAGVLRPLAGVVLSIEDNPVNQILLEAIFVRWPDVRLLQAADGATALAMARAERPDLVLLDMHLPDMDGYELLHALRADPRTQALRVIALSANALPDEVSRAYDAGVLDYLTKPIDVPKFEARMRVLLGAAD